MGWFRSTAPGTADPRRLVASVARIRDGRSAGAGVLLTPDQLLTCAHVVNDALGRDLFATRHPAREPVRVSLQGPTGTRRLEARTRFWIPPRRLDGVPEVRAGRDPEWLGDLAVLQLDEPHADATAPPHWQPMKEGQVLRAWHGTGLRSSFADVEVTACDGTIGYVDGACTGMPIGPAYSGGPLWSAVQQAVVGIVAAHIMPPEDPATGLPAPFSSQHVARRSWGIPWQRVESELRAAGAGRLFDGREPDPDDPALPVLTDLIETLVPSPTLRADYGRAVADRCGLGYRDDGSAPTPEEFAQLLVTEPKALAAMTEVLRRQDPSSVARLLAAGQLSRTPRLLSPLEHRKLRRILDSLPEAVLGRLPEAVRAALPLAAALPAGEGTEEMIDHLECLLGDSRAETEGLRVPGLLRVMEYMAVLCPSAQQAGLRLWCDGVAERLGIPRSALRERRSDADDWAVALAARTAPPRVLVEVTGAPGDRYRLRVWCDEGAGLRQLSDDGGVTYSRAEAARELLRVLESAHRGSPDRRPVVEAVVDRAGLNLPIDEWEGQGPDDLVPGVLGAEYPVVVNCPELLRRNERFVPDWHRRWGRLDSGSTLLFSDPAPGQREVYGTLMDRLDAVRVTVDVQPGARDGIVQLCLAVGIPVVLWDRGPVQEPHAVGRMAEVTTRELPEGTRTYRAKALQRPGEFPGRPVLAWADADRAAPMLLLSEPEESI
ncbi:trypsin-like peptidase domain-containing protein [Streptomyces sp. URMC 127]|uniref:VMAP-C domain-containing protein n=1 Tax=Streptomyces sp. URMC 127 TaxID=3423402 RepID=UPI003F1C80EE